jgi:hypothetical protein
MKGSVERQFCLFFFRFMLVPAGRIGWVDVAYVRAICLEVSPTNRLRFL